MGDGVPLGVELGLACWRRRRWGVGWDRETTAAIWGVVLSWWWCLVVPRWTGAVASEDAEGGGGGEGADVERTGPSAGWKTAVGEVADRWGKVLGVALGLRWVLLLLLLLLGGQERILGEAVEGGRPRGGRGGESVRV